ncbi:MAG: oligosaccharide flippase family protein [Alphaproteobacteria bacterium]
METSILIRITAIRNVLQFLIQFAASVVVARTLSPGEIGIFSVAMAAVGVATVLRSGSIGVYLVQLRDLETKHIACSFGLSITFSFILGLAVIAAAPYVADLYQSEKIENVLYLISIGFFLLPPQTVASSLLSRELSFGRLTLAGLSATAVSSTVAVTLALNGFGAMALAWGALCNSIIGLVAFSILGPREMWVWPRFFRGWKEVWDITSWVILSSALAEVNARINELVVGKTLSLADAALLERAATLPRLVWRHMMPPVLAIISPVVAHEVRAGENLRNSAVRRMRYFGCVFVPILAGMASQSDNLILGIYGDQWGEAVLPATWFCIASAITGQFTIINPILNGIGRTRDVFKIHLFTFVCRLPVLFATASISINAVAIGQLGVAIIASVFSIHAANRNGVILIRDLPSALWPGLFCGIFIFSVGYVTNTLLSDFHVSDHIVALLISILVLAISLVAVLRVVEPDILRFALKVLNIGNRRQ